MSDPIQPNKKLKLNKKTIRALDEQQLDGVVGAGTICCGDTCQGICTGGGGGGGGLEPDQRN